MSNYNTYTRNQRGLPQCCPALVPPLGRFRSDNWDTVTCSSTYAMLNSYIKQGNDCMCFVKFRFLGDC